MVLLERKVNINEISTCQKLHNQARGDNGAYFKFHKSAPVGGKDDTHPQNGSDKLEDMML